MAHVPAEQRRHLFVEAAVRVIAQHGVSGATTRKIAEEAGAPPATLHYCFRSKEEIFYELFKQQAEKIEEKADYGLEGEGLAAASARLLNEIVAWYRSDPDYTRAQMELLMWSIRQPQYPDLAVRSYDIHEKLFAEVLRHGLAEGEDESLVDLLAEQIPAVADGLSLQWFTYQDDDKLQRGMEFAAQSFAALIEQRHDRTKTVKARSSSKPAAASKKPAATTARRTSKTSK
ncbi:TetR/AcrR family transcriptional regulator [Rhodococcus sp. JVH1]|uniref:TetR/AcrR family transcriptional regulator n=1 Tax=Rhodococcus sp. JVH1 TaxID=745408 RepID=UPI000271FEF9|nr:TetR/AcrR family transcriptional regulator [Rhodococcus sp. JVH1]EJI93337.1 transcriptional regulator, TetR family [Rhodococcus sp. JVH1]